MKILKFLITRNVSILSLILLITTVQLINCLHLADHGVQRGNNISLTAKDGTIYTYDPEPPKALRLGSGSFGSAVIGEIRTLVAMKIATDDVPMLNREHLMYKRLNGLAGIPRLFDYFPVSDDKAILVIELLGKSLQHFIESTEKFSIKTSMMLGLRILDIIEAIHEKGLIYNDIKPDNFAVGREDKSKIYILDFGLTEFYMVDGEHVQEGSGGGSGTPIYMSLYSHSHFVQSRRDDIESIAYMLIEFLNGELWQGDSIEEIIDQKSTWTVEKIAGQKCYETMLKFLKYARRLYFNEKPDYGYLRGLLQDELTKHQLINDGRFDWIEPSTEAEVVQSPGQSMKDKQRRKKNKKQRKMLNKAQRRFR